MGSRGATGKSILWTPSRAVKFASYGSFFLLYIFPIRSFATNLSPPYIPPSFSPFPLAHPPNKEAVIPATEDRPPGPNSLKPCSSLPTPKFPVLNARRASIRVLAMIK